MLIHESSFFKTLVPYLPGEGIQKWATLEEEGWERLSTEDWDLVLYSYPSLEDVEGREAWENLLDRTIFELADLLDVMADRPPQRFVFLSSSKAGDPESVLGALYRNGEVLVEGYSSHIPVVSRNLRRMKAPSPPGAEDFLDADHVLPPILEWLIQERSGGTFEICWLETSKEWKVLAVDTPGTDYQIAKKIIKNMKHLVTAGQTLEAVRYLRQLHTQKRQE